MGFITKLFEKQFKDNP